MFVVDGLEPVEVEEHQPDVATIALAASARLGNPYDQCAAVGHARQRVLGRDRAELLLESATVAQVDDLDDGVQRRPVVALTRAADAWV